MGILDNLGQLTFEPIVPALGVWNGRLGVRSENTLQSRGVRQIPAFDVGLGGADYDIPRVARIPG